ncbi:hypothetical protein EV363DRAFT_1357363, partial [Boletus edulis]
RSNRDVQLSLSCSREYLAECLLNKDTVPAVLFHPDHRPRGTLDDFLSSDGTFFTEAFRAEPHVALYDVEFAVEQGIDAWVDDVTNVAEACVKLDVLADRYYCDALKMYANNPEQLSIMLLTTIELWIALDKLVLKEIPMLKDYNSDISAVPLANLLLRKSTSIGRLRRARQYLSRRHSRTDTKSSIFSQATSEETFAVRYYNQSSSLQELKGQIEEAALQEIDKKTEELKRANEQHAKVKLRADGIHHAYATLGATKRHAPNCRKCNLEGKLNSMKLEVYEWPLPDDDLRAAIVVTWRSTMFRLLVSLSKSHRPRGKRPFLLSDYHALQPYFSSSRPVEHRTLFIPATEDQIRVENSLTFFGFNTWEGIPVANAFSKVDIKRYCTYELQEGPYCILQKYIDGTTHTSNQVVAGQAECPKELSIHEFLAFGHLRSGGSLQWLNILRELRDRSLSFRNAEVHLLVAQAIMQDTFGHALVDELESLVADIEANWLEGVTMNTISSLLSRLLEARPDEAVSERVVQLLRDVRMKTFSWVQELSDKLTRTPGEEELRGLLRDTAAICRSTFDVDPVIIEQLLNSPEDVEVLLSCAILIHDNLPTKVSALPAYSQLLLDRNRHLSLALENVLYDPNGVMVADSRDRGIHLAVGRVWPDYRPGSEWRPLPEPNSRYFLCTTASTMSQCSQVVHFNLLDGTLLVDGKPLGRLPNAVVQHPLYSLVFGEQVLDVIAGDLPGMDYTTRGMISGHQVYFSLRDTDLVIRAKRTVGGRSEVIQLIPRTKLENDFPAILLKGHIHWLNLSTSVMEFRPIDKPWEGSSENWSINCTPGQYRMRKGRQLLLDVRSPSWSVLSSLLKPLEAPQNLLVTASPINPDLPSSSLRLAVALPRYGLSFYLNENGNLQSHNIRDMVYDENQSTGTLFGLVNQLVLRPKLRDNINTSELVPRCVLIPEGEVSFRMDGHHVRVEVDTRGPALQRVTYQTYRIDTELNCLTGNISLTNKLYRAYLHALTSSGCSNDPLTGKSGTEEALGLLQSASCHSIIKFSARDAELLRLIASLRPLRSFHSRYRHVQVVHWLNLPIRSQHHNLYFAAKEIKNHVEKAQLFHDGWETDGLKNFPSHDDHLFTRSLLRTRHLLPSEPSEQPSRGDHDATYHFRDVISSDSAEHHAFMAAAAIYQWSVDTVAFPMTNLMDLVESWKSPLTSNAVFSFAYHRSWLNPRLPAIWINAYNALRESKKAQDRFSLLFSLSSMAYHSQELSPLVPIFLAFAVHPELRAENPLARSNYDLSDGHQPTQPVVSQLVTDCAHKFYLSPEKSIPARRGETSRAEVMKRQRQSYDARLHADANSVADQVVEAWPASRIPPTVSLNPDAYDCTQLNSSIRTLFQSCSRNVQLWEHLARVQDILRDLKARSRALPLPRYRFDPSLNIRFRTPPLVTLDQLMFIRPPPPVQPRDRLLHFIAGEMPSSSSGFHELQRLITTIQGNSTDSFQKQYASDLEASARHCCDEASRTLASQVVMEEPSGEEIELLKDYYRLCRDVFAEAVARIRDILGPLASNASDRALEQSGQWPRITTDTLVRCIASTSPINLTRPWKKCLTRLALLLLELQLARRLLHLASSGHYEEFYKELDNGRCDGWDPEAEPDWILIQLQGDFLIRRVQVDVANELVSPRSGDNTAMQLNMGEGKSSVIVPISVTKLADGDQLVRIVVPKALTTQMFQILVDRLSGITNRQIYYLPFSRSLTLGPEQVDALQSLMSECVRKRGVMIVQPDHVLSLKLVTVEKQLSSDRDTALPLLKLQTWLHSTARDILDESDEILHVRYQLIYAIGCQQAMEGFPERWTTTQQVLAAVRKHAVSLRTSFKEGIEYESGPPGSFPRIRILQPDAAEALISQIARDAMDGLLPNFNFQQLNSELRDAILSFLTEKDVFLPIFKSVEEYARRSTLWGGLLLLRGLLATDILLFAFRDQRWRVDYGLAPKRHPDAAIVLTCLSYYYEGLTEEQLKISLQLLLSEDDPSVNYDLWIRDCPSVPHSLRNYMGINLDSSEQWTTLLIPSFSRNHATIDFFLAKVVFPKEAKEFPSKLACSGWDLAEKKERLVTGFSGTNDGQYLLPLHITQQNNSTCLLPTRMASEDLPSNFLQILVAQEPEIRVLLDSGFAISSNTSAALYFNEDDELTVLTRDGSTQLLLSSPFPIGFRAAVTLGPKVTKDRLAQCCMRMRKLGHGHSLMFFAPLEVDRRIRSVARKGPQDVINTMDILHWTVRETCDDIQRRTPHWAQQGTTHETRYNAWSKYCTNELTPEQLSKHWLQPEVKSLVELYAPCNASHPTTFTIPEIRERCFNLGITSLSHEGGMDEEQEREIIREVEREQEVERPRGASPAKHSRHDQVVNFIKTGVIPNQPSVFHPIFTTLGNTSAVTNEPQVWSRWVLATEDFCRTIVTSKGSASSKVDEFLRPVQWILSSQTAVRQILIILSPYEVNQLLPDIRNSKHVHLHLYTPRMTKSMKLGKPAPSRHWCLSAYQALASSLIVNPLYYAADPAIYLILVPCRTECPPLQCLVVM